MPSGSTEPRKSRAYSSASAQTLVCALTRICWSPTFTVSGLIVKRHVPLCLAVPLSCFSSNDTWKLAASSSNVQYQPPVPSRLSLNTTSLTPSFGSGVGGTAGVAVGAGGNVAVGSGAFVGGGVTVGMMTGVVGFTIAVLVGMGCVGTA